MYKDAFSAQMTKMMFLFLEAKLVINGYVNMTDFAFQFPMSRPPIIRYFNEWIAFMGNIVQYDKSAKTYIYKNTEEPNPSLFASPKEAQDFLDLLKTLEHLFENIKLS